MAKNKNKKFWFKPKRVGKWVAAYYPVTLGGWIIVLVLVAALAKIFWLIDRTSHSGSDTLIAFAPYFMVGALIFDLLCFRLGQYPSWWRKK